MTTNKKLDEEKIIKLICMRCCDGFSTGEEILKTIHQYYILREKVKKCNHPIFIENYCPICGKKLN